MSTPAPIRDRRWLRIAHWFAAAGALAAWLYLAGGTFGWWRGVAGSTSSLLLLGSSTALIWSLLVFRRYDRGAIMLLVLAGFLLVWAIVAFVQEN